ncbi:hypothetical protein CEXT_308351 [Caerostris extrusa]|uniref:Uncharacterized protein n=1 Tax=Caerostris extrusa TaxID=172846 RepID=A0AAV4S3E1_CAEEX|nr:hypothetical protein CEXT_308351 [Caerostris extrusa]
MVSRLGRFKEITVASMCCNGGEERGGSAKKMSESGDEVNTEVQECPEVEEDMLEITIEAPEEEEEEEESYIEINDDWTQAPILEIFFYIREDDENASVSANSDDGMRRMAEGEGLVPGIVLFLLEQLVLLNGESLECQDSEDWNSYGCF